jgi:hypothetical protein
MTSLKSPWGEDLSPGMVAGQAKATPPKAEKSGLDQKRIGLEMPPENGESMPNQPLITVDRRSGWARRLRDISRGYISDLGGVENTSSAERSLVRRIAGVTIQLEVIEAKMADEDGQISQAYTDLYFRGSAHLGRLLKMLGLKRREKDITPGGMSRALYDLYVAEGKIEPEEDSE